MPRSSSTSNSLDVLIGAAIRARRNELGWSQADLASRIGVTYQQVQKYETGANRVAATTLAGIAAGLGCSLSALVPSDTVSDPAAVSVVQQIRAAALALPDDQQQLLLDVAQGFLRAGRREPSPPSRSDEPADG
ncbi:helix-turn-helix domain-containing protein [Brevundimonas sp. BAL3]|uniref:helix-turn-helix domain-containing protein n=1 Tax=Brevundimonas sp. BAL3 TaxID=391600 RepID=UPI00067F951C|nr:helix-turn-helix transcriptional regulator [Brevundimonas sp. BAL3]